MAVPFFAALLCLIALIGPAAAMEFDPLADTASDVPMMTRRVHLPEKTVPASQSLFYSKRVYSPNSAISRGEVRKGFDFEYIGGEIIFDRTAILRTRRETKFPTGAEVYLHIPLGKVSPFVSFGENLRATTIGNGVTEKENVWVSGGANIHIDEHTDLFGRYNYVDRGAMLPWFKKPERIVSFGLVHRF